MYERSAIVLERYFENLLGFNKANNLKQNFKNYCDLFEKFNSFQDAKLEEFNVLEEFQVCENTIEEIQNSQEKLYKKNAKLEYNRDLIFNDITQKPDEIEKCIIKIENDVSKNQANLVSLRERFVEAIRNYNEKKSLLAKCKKNRRNAEKEYNESFEIIKQSLENIEEEYVQIATSFATEGNENNLIALLLENGKEEKIPFNNFVITNAAKLGMDIVKREAEAYVELYEMAKKLINELLEGAVSIELHTKIIRNIKVKLNFLNAEKDYLVQFLDYERITVMYGKRTHRTLMMEACEKFEVDIVQINNLYQLLLKEISNKSTKKAYKELYNKSYLVDIEEKEAKFKKEKSKINLPVGTVMNSNYWRIEGIKNIYTVFYKDVSEVFGKDLVEFDVPKEPEIVEQEETEIVEEIKQEEKIETIEIIEQFDQEEAEPENIEIIEELEQEETEPENIEIIEELEQEETEQKNIDAIEAIEQEETQPETIEKVETLDKEKETSKKKLKRYTRKISSNSKTIILEEKTNYEGKEENINYIKEENSKNEVKENKEKKKNKDVSLFEKSKEDDEISIMDDIPYEKDDLPFEEESIFDEFENLYYEELNSKKDIAPKKEKTKKRGFFSKIRKLNAKEKKQVSN